MILKTKKYSLLPSTYIKVALWNILRGQWWASLLFFLIGSALFYFGRTGWGITVVVLFFVYIAFWFLQLYAVTTMKNTKVFFSRFSYVINSKQILMQMTNKQGMPIAWDQVKKAQKKKKVFILFLNKAQFLYLPYRIFNTPQEIRFMTLLLKRKGLIK